jgi:hypothetical protein
MGGRNASERVVTIVVARSRLALASVHEQHGTEAGMFKPGL